MTTTKKTTTKPKTTKAPAKPKSIVADIAPDGPSSPFKDIYCDKVETKLAAIQVPGGCIVKYNSGLCFVPKVKLANIANGAYELVDGR